MVAERSRNDGSYGLKLDFGWCDSLELFDNDDWLPGDDLSRLLSDFCRFLPLFSIFAISFGFGASAPIALHVCANNANGLFFASNCVEKKKQIKDTNLLALFEMLCRIMLQENMKMSELKSETKRESKRRKTT